jgi:broad specificity phosphatase PhoE
MKILFNALVSIFFLLPLNVNATEVDATETKGTFYFVRHGITDWNMDTLLDGPQDLLLNERGKSDIQALATVFEKLGPSSENFPTSILYSSLKRCVQTMEIVQEKLSINKLEKFDDLKEVYRGDWSKLEGETKDLAIRLLKEKKYVDLFKIEVEDAEK